MSQTKNDSVKIRKADIIIITLMILNLISDNVPILNGLFDYISNTGYKLGIPLLLTIRLAILVLFVLFALNYLHKRYKIARVKYKKLKTRKQKHKDKINILRSIKDSIKWYPHCKHEELNLTKIELGKYIEILIKKKFIEQRGVFIIRITIETPIYILTEKGKQWLKKTKVN